MCGIPFVVCLVLQSFTFNKANILYILHNKSSITTSNGLFISGEKDGLHVVFVRVAGRVGSWVARSFPRVPFGAVAAQEASSDHDEDRGAPSHKEGASKFVPATTPRTFNVNNPKESNRHQNIPVTSPCVGWCERVVKVLSYSVAVPRGPHQGEEAWKSSIIRIIRRRMTINTNMDLKSSTMGNFSGGSTSNEPILTKDVGESGDICFQMEEVKEKKKTPQDT